VIKILIAISLLSSSEHCTNVRLIQWCSQELRFIAIRNEVLDHKEAVSFFNIGWAEHFHLTDLETIKRRLIEAQDYPYLNSLLIYSYVPKEAIDAMTQVNNERISALESYIKLYSADNQATQERNGLLVDNMILRSLSAAKHESSYIFVRRQKLNELKKLIGDDNFYKGLFYWPLTK